uniref:Uncharacterized protein n=1 Tax=Cacopsylla melanoneura TaxID=428564 RepID=A0A8D9ALM3_9HEMI
MIMETHPPCARLKNHHPNIPIYLLPLLILSSIPFCSTFDESDWYEVNPYQNIEYNLMNFTDKDLCQGDQSECLSQFRQYISDYFEGGNVRASCEPEPKLLDAPTVCWCI